MSTIFRLALRNLKEHKSKTIIISLFLIFGVAIVILGNSFLESVNRGLEKDFRQNYTGDLVFSAVPEKGDIIDIFEVHSTNISGILPQIPALPELEKVQSLIDQNPKVKISTKQISAQVLFAKNGEFDMTSITEDDNLELSDLPIAMLFAGETDSYWKTFSKINIKEGTLPRSKTDDILIDTRVVKSYERVYKEKLCVGDKILLMGANSKGVIREGTVCGIFTPPDENSAMFQIIYCAPELARSFADLTYASSFKEELPDSVDLNLSSMNEDELFGDIFDEEFEISEDSSLNSQSSTDFNNILGDTSLRNELNTTDSGSWHFILAKLEHPNEAKKVISQFNQLLKENGINDVQVMDWKQAAYSYSGTVEGISVIFNILIVILAVVVFIIIMNTMTLSVIERTSEIGTMRAIGADKKFINILFFTESFSLTFFSSLIGIVLALILSAIFNACNFTVSNEIVKMILGGGLLHFSPTPKIIILTLLIAVAGGILSNIYPVTSALKITPLKALSKGSE